MFLGLGSSAGMARGAGASRVPTDPETLNAFADQYRAYIEGLRNNVVSIKQWARVARAWRRLTGE